VNQAIPTRTLGRTGQQVSILCLGGWHIRSIKDDTEAIRIMHAALDGGMTFFDNAWDYHDGGSEEIMGLRAFGGGQASSLFSYDKKLRTRSADHPPTHRRQLATTQDGCDRPHAVP
jgi:predicted aldo/keto reductase-like oxidoreductase